MKAVGREQETVTLDEIATVLLVAEVLLRQGAQCRRGLAQAGRLRKDLGEMLEI